VIVRYDELKMERIACGADFYMTREDRVRFVACFEATNHTDLWLFIL
jgi:hypothetical protein